MRFSRLIFPTIAPALMGLILLACDATAQSYYGTYGKEITAKGAKSLGEAAEMISDDEQFVKLEGAIDRTCKMKGCWMEVSDAEGNTMRVTFKDYGFFVPKEGVEGKTAVMEGALEKKMISVEELRHYAEDAGKSEEEIAAITEPRMELSFVADGVIIK